MNLDDTTASTYYDDELTRLSRLAGTPTEEHSPGAGPEPGALEQIIEGVKHPMTPIPGLEKVEKAVKGEGKDPETLGEVATKTGREFASTMLPTTVAGAATAGLAGPALKLAKTLPVLGFDVGKWAGSV